MLQISRHGDGKNNRTFRVTKENMAEYLYLAIIWCGKIFVHFEEYIPLQNLNKQTNPADVIG